MLVLVSLINPTGSPRAAGDGCVGKTLVPHPGCTGETDSPLAAAGTLQPGEALRGCQGRGSGRAVELDDEVGELLAGQALPQDCCEAGHVVAEQDGGHLAVLLADAGEAVLGADGGCRADGGHVAVGAEGPAPAPGQPGAGGCRGDACAGLGGIAGEYLGGGRAVVVGCGHDVNGAAVFLPRA